MPLEINAISQAEHIRPRIASDQPAHPEPSAGRAAEAGVAVETDQALASAGPPIDADRVKQIRHALETDSYPIVPTRIADAVIAARLLLSTAQ